MFYFDNKNMIRSFFVLIKNVWFFEWNYSFEIRRWIKNYFSKIINSNKQRISNEFEKSNNSNCFQLNFNIRFMIANEIYNLKIDNFNIKIVINWLIFQKSQRFFAKKKSRRSKNWAKKSFLLTQRWICISFELINN